MSEKKELNQEELQQVSGGRGGGGGGTETTMDHYKSKVYLGKELTIYETEQHIGEEVFIAADSPYQYLIGTLKASWEDTHYRMVTVDCKIGPYAGQSKTAKLLNGTWCDSQVWLVNGYK